MAQRLSKMDLYKWFDKRPVRGSSTYRLFEIFLIQNWDEDLQATVMSRKDIISATGWKWSEIDKHIMFVDMNQLWDIQEDSKILFTPKT